MKSALSSLENEFDTLLDSYCVALEQGDIIEAETAAIRAEDFLEAIEVIRFSRALASVHGGVEMGTLALS